jgi:hypothetical protein
VSLIDDRGRLFGRVNLIDALVAVVALGLIPLSYGAYLMFRPPIPKIIKVSPGEVPVNAAEDDRPRLQITGENLREALLAVFGRNPGVHSPGFLVQDSQRGEVIVPVLPVGTYDLSFVDGQRVLVTVPGALRVVAPPPPVKAIVPPVRSALALVTIRFFAEPEVRAVMKVGDVDVSESGVAGDRAVLTEVGSERDTVSALVVTDTVLGRNFQIQRPVLVFTGRVRVPVVYTPAGWSYKNRPVKVGGQFFFVTAAGGMGGSILDVKVREQK